MAQAEQRDAQAAQAKIDYEASLLTGVQDVEDALNKVWSQETRKNHWSLPTSRHETLRQPHGRITVPAFRDFTVVLTTQRTLLTVQESLASVEAEIAQGYIDLYTALGGGWTVPQEFKK